MNEHAGVVVILGAGASHAINSVMPLTDELGDQAALAVEGFDSGRYKSLPGWFEAVLSRLAEEQPDLEEGPNLHNRSLFHELATAATSVINEREALAVSEPIPEWLANLCMVWHERRTTLVTFNYDSLIERAISALGLYDWGSKRGVTADDIIERLPPWPPGPGRFGPGEMPATMRLKKLHGSVAWYAVPGDTSGATLARRRVGGWRAEAIDANEIRRDYPGRRPFIVPPASAKSDFYRNPVLRQLWQDAGDALSRASEVHLVGYSLPAADLVTRGMLRDRTFPAARWTVADPALDRVRTQLGSLGFSPSHEHSSVEAYATSELSRLAADTKRTLTQLVRDASPETPIVVAWGETPAFSLLPQPDATGGLVTQGSPVALGQLVNGLEYLPHLSAGDLAGILHGKDHPHLEVHVDGRQTKVISANPLDEYSAPVPRPVIALRCALPRPAG